ncbi:hypothetical protein ES703_73246 [subsurface metagenome]
MEIEYRIAVAEDLTAIVAFVDFWLTGGGIPDGVPGSAHDFFVPVGRHKGYLAKYVVLLALCASEIVGWAVETKKGVLIHLLVAGTFRAQGIGSEMLKKLRPDVVRSKFDQSTGDPAGFYSKHGFIKESSRRVGKKKNIDIFVRPGVVRTPGPAIPTMGGDSALEAAFDDEPSCGKQRRTIDIMSSKLGK